MSNDKAMPVYSEAHREYLRQRQRSRFLIQLTRVFLLVFLLWFWEFAANQRWCDPFLTSQPSRMLQTLSRMLADGSLWKHLSWTAGETVLGFGLGSVFGLVLAIALWWSPFWARVCEPYLVILNSLPKVALGPLFIVWLGTGLEAIVAVTLMVSMIVTVLQIYSGFQEVDPHYHKLASSFGASRFELLRYIVFPAALPSIISALKVGVGLSMVGVIVGEFLVAKQGLGYLIIYGGQVFNLNLVMTSTAILLVMAGVFYGLVVIMEKAMMKNR